MDSGHHQSSCTTYCKLMSGHDEDGLGKQTIARFGLVKISFSFSFSYTRATVPVGVGMTVQKILLVFIPIRRVLKLSIKTCDGSFLVSH